MAQIEPVQDKCFKYLSSNAALTIKFCYMITDQDIAFLVPDACKANDKKRQQ
jgi:hypothetical protein